MIDVPDTKDYATFVDACTASRVEMGPLPTEIGERCMTLDGVLWKESELEDLVARTKRVRLLSSQLRDLRKLEEELGRTRDRLAKEANDAYQRLQDLEVDVRRVKMELAEAAVEVARR